MNAVMIQTSGAELVSYDTSCISAAPLGLCVICISDTLVILDVKGERVKLPIGDLINFLQQYGERI